MPILLSIWKWSKMLATTIYRQKIKSSIFVKSALFSPSFIEKFKSIENNLFHSKYILLYIHIYTHTHLHTHIQDSETCL